MNPSRFAHIDYKRWRILDALADDWESPEQIAKFFADSPAIFLSPIELTDLIEELFNQHYIFLTMNVRFERSGILAELNHETKDRPYWFGRTDLGYMAWQALAGRF